MVYCYLVLSFQLIILIFYLTYFLINVCKRKLELSKLEKIDKNDKEKFLYYREILKSYSIGELGYLFNGKKKTNLLIMAELENLKLKKCISIDSGKVTIIEDTNISKSEKYILEHYKFINDKQFKINYLKNIEISLKEKNCINNHKLKLDPKLLISFIIFVFLFFIGLYLALNNDSNTLFFAIEAIIFLIVWIVCLISMLAFNKEFTMVKTSIGKDIYLKLNGLKNYIKDFGSFDDKNLNEIVLWEEYILYAIILDESNILSKQANEELNNLINIVYK